MKELLSPKYLSRIAPALLFVGVFLVPLKLSLAYVALIPLIFFWLLGALRAPHRLFGKLNHPLVLPLWVFIGTSFLSGLCGVSPTTSIVNLLRFSFFALIPLIIIDLTPKGKEANLLLAYLFGQTISAIYTVIWAITPFNLPRVFLGAVTESGQLAFGCVLGIAAAIGILGVSNHAPTIKQLGLNDTLRESGLIITKLLASLAALTLCGALIINLKRGPWLGAFTGVCILLLIHRRRLILPLIIIAATLPLFIPEIYERLAASKEHFLIVGGRKEIWDIGLTLSQEYPMGIGYGNSPILRSFSTEIPKELTHFHNNFLNILVENGWFSLLAFFWWIASFLHHAFKTTLGEASSTRLIRSGLGCALISWQVAGLVEYNFGDSEVLLVAYITIGLLWLMVERVQPKHNKSSAIHTKPTPQIMA